MPEPQITVLDRLGRHVWLARTIGQKAIVIGLTVLILVLLWLPSPDGTLHFSRSIAGILLFPLSFAIFAFGTRGAFGMTVRLAEADPLLGPGFLTGEAAAILVTATTDADLLNTLSHHHAGLFLLARLGLPLSTLPALPGITDDQIFVEWGRVLAIKIGDEQIDVHHLLAGMLVNEPTWQPILQSYELTADDVINVLFWQSRIVQAETLAKNRWQHIRVQTGGGLGGAWSSGATYTLDQYATDLSNQFLTHPGQLHLFGKEQAVSALERVLSQQEGANGIIVGPTGVGKRNVILGLAERMSTGQTVPALRYKRLLELDVNQILASAPDPRALEARLTQILNEATRAGNVIVFISHLTALLGTGTEVVGSINAIEVLLPYLAARSLHLVGSLTPEEYRTNIEANPALADQFQKIELAEPDEATTIRIVEEAVPQMEVTNRVIVTYQAVKQAILLADRYIHDVPFPEKAISLLDQSVVQVAQLEGHKIVTAQDIQAIVTARTHVPVGEASRSEKTILLNLEAELHKRVVGQDEAVSAVADALRRARSGLNRGNRPIGSFLFIGPTGVGKTETAKAVSAAYFGSEEAMLRFDMSEYKSADSVGRLLGEGSQAGQLTEPVRTKPFALLLFDEIEKCHPYVLDLFLQILDDGRLTDGSGRLIDFRNTLIVATSNAGAELVREALLKQMAQAELKKMLVDYLLEHGIFKPEFLNRFDGVIAFSPLTLEQVTQITRLLLAELEQSLVERRIQLQITDQAIQALAERGYDPTLGARPLRRLLQDTVEDKLAKQMLADQVGQGSVVTIDVPDLRA